MGNRQLVSSSLTSAALLKTGVIFSDVTVSQMTRHVNRAADTLKNKLSHLNLNLDLGQNLNLNLNLNLDLDLTLDLNLDLKLNLNLNLNLKMNLNLNLCFWSLRSQPSPEPAGGAQVSHVAFSSHLFSKYRKLVSVETEVVLVVKLDQNNLSCTCNL